MGELHLRVHELALQLFRPRDGVARQVLAGRLSFKRRVVLLAERPRGEDGTVQGGLRFGELGLELLLPIRPRRSEFLLERRDALAATARVLQRELCLILDGKRT